MSKQLKCTTCEKIKEVERIVIKVINGEVRYLDDECECGGRCITANPKTGAPRLNFTDSGTGKKVVK